MKSKHIFIPIIIALILVLIIFNQFIWIHNMYKLHKQEIIDYANQVAELTILKEITERCEKMGGYSVYSASLNIPKDTSRFFTKKVMAEDTTYILKIDKNETYINEKIIQFLIKNEMPVNLNVLDSLFRMELKTRYAIKNSYFDYIDLEKRSTLKSSKAEGANNNYLSTDTIPLDIQKSIAVVGYIETPNDVILQKMFFQLALTVLLILCSFSGLFYISRSFVLQWRNEKLRQNSVNAMTHEFKRPISGAVAMASTIPFFLEKQNLSKVKDYAGKILTELNKLTAYTQRIQQISNNDKSNISLNIIELDVREFLNNIVEKYKSDEFKKLSIKTAYNTSKNKIRIDELHFANVLDNLIENAIKYSDKEVEIIISLTDTPNGLCFNISDNGYGMSAYDARHAFDKYHRSMEKRIAKKAGFGLGLTYCKSIVDAHKGNIDVYSKLNEGSTFTILLPD